MPEAVGSLQDERISELYSIEYDRRSVHSSKAFNALPPDRFVKAGLTIHRQQAAKQALRQAWVRRCLLRGRTHARQRRHNIHAEAIRTFGIDPVDAEIELARVIADLGEHEVASLKDLYA